MLPAKLLGKISVFNQLKCFKTSIAAECLLDAYLQLIDCNYNTLVSKRQTLMSAKGHYLLLHWMVHSVHWLWIVLKSKKYFRNDTKSLHLNKDGIQMMFYPITPHITPWDYSRENSTSVILTNRPAINPTHYLYIPFKSSLYTFDWLSRYWIDDWFHP